MNLYEDVLSLNRFLHLELPAGCIGEVRPIKPGDEQLLAAVEAAGLERAVLSVRQASGAGRDIARTLCGKLGVPTAGIPRSPKRYPIWPVGITGSITHDAEFAAAVVAPTGRFGGVGIDIEPAVPLTRISAILSDSRTSGQASPTSPFATRHSSPSKRPCSRRSIRATTCFWIFTMSLSRLPTELPLSRMGARYIGVF